MTEQEIMAMTDNELDCAVAELIDNIHFDYHPSKNGNQLLDIMNREHISVTYEAENFWSADNYDVANNDKESVAMGKTINQAVLRCYLASQQGGNNG